MSKRVYHRYLSRSVHNALTELGLPRNGCTVIGLSRAVSAPDNEADAIDWLPIIAEELRGQWVATNGRIGLDDNGTYWGWIHNVLDRIGVAYERVRPEPRYKTFEPRYSWPYERPYYPTVKTWLERNPNVRRAVIHSRGHVAFIDRDSVYGAGPRHRILNAYILEGIAS